ncbi:MAG TPA: hypothetical protein VMT46_18880 [Anaerolineaceae bacterium]|nr:hypothetical protein [Anaerolineaceae bacterium]
MAEPDRIEAFNRAVDRMAGLTGPASDESDPTLRTVAGLVQLGRESRANAPIAQRDAWARAAAQRQQSQRRRKILASFSTWGLRAAAALGILALAVLSIYMIRQQAARHAGPAPARPASAEPLPEGAVRRLGRGTLTTMVLSPDGSHLAVGSYLGVYLFDAHTFQQLWFKPADRQVRQIAFRPDGQALAVVQEGGAVTLMNTVDGAALLDLNQPPGMLVGQVSWSPDGKRLASGSPDGAIALWDAQTGKQDLLLQSPFESPATPFTETAWTPDGSRVITHTLGQIRVWDPVTGQKLSEFNLNKAQTFDLLLSPARPWLIVNSLGDSQIDLWNWQTGQIERSLRIRSDQGGLSALGWSSDGKRVLGKVSYPPQILAWDADSGEMLQPYSLYATEATYSPDNSVLYTAGPLGVNALDSTTGAQLRGLSDLYPTNYTGAVYRMTWDSQGIVTSQAGLTLWNPKDGTARPLFTEDLKDPRTFAAWSGLRADGGRDYLVYKSDQTAWIRRGDKEWQIANVRDMTEFAWSPDGKLLASGETVWDVESGHVLSEFQGNRHFANLPAWSPDGQRLASGTVDGTVAVWDPQTGEVKLTLEPGILWVPEVAWSPDGKLLAVMGNANNNTGDPPTLAWIYDAQTGAVVQHWEAPGGHTQGMAWSPDGRWLAAGKSSGEVRVWDTSIWKEVYIFLGHRDQVITVAWSPDSARLASGGMDGQILIWAVGKSEPAPPAVTPAPTSTAQASPLPGGSGISVASAPGIRQAQAWGKGAVHGVSYSQDGRQIAVLSTLGLALLDSESYHQTDFFHTLGTTGHGSTAAVSSDWSLVAVGTGAGVDLLRREDHQLLRSLTQNYGIINELFFTRDGSRLVGLANHPGSEDYSWTVVVWRVSDGTLVSSQWGTIPWATQPGEMQPSFSTSGDLAVFWKYPDPSGIQIVNLRNGDLNWALSQANTPLAAAVSTDEKTIAILNQDGRIDLLSLETRAGLHSLQIELSAQSPVYFLTFSQDDTLLVGRNGDGKVFAWQVSDGHLLYSFQADPLAYTMALSPDRSALALNTLETVHFWNLANGTLFGELPGYTLPVQAIAVSPIGERVASLSQGGDRTPLTVWGTAQDSPLWSSAGYSALSLAWSPDGSQLALGLWDGSISLVSAADGQKALDLRLQPDPSAQIRCLAYAPGGAELASGSMGIVRVWDLAGGSLKRSLNASTESWIDSVAYSPDGRYLAASSADGILWLWNTSDGGVVAKLPVETNGHTGQLAFTPDGRTLALAVDSAVYTWPVVNPQAPQRMDLDGTVAQGLAFAPSGDILAVALDNGVIQLLSFPEGSLLASLSGHTGGVSSLSFSADGFSLFSGSYDGTVRQWKWTP